MLKSLHIISLVYLFLFICAFFFSLLLRIRLLLFAAAVFSVPSKDWAHTYINKYSYWSRASLGHIHVKRCSAPKACTTKCTNIHHTNTRNLFIPFFSCEVQQFFSSSNLIPAIWNLSDNRNWHWCWILFTYTTKINKKNINGTTTYRSWKIDM